MTKEEIIAAIRKCAQKLGRAPKRSELKKMCGIPPRKIALLFRGMTRAVRAAGLEPAGGPGYEIESDDLMMDWARLARKLGKAPSLAEYRHKGRYSHVPFVRRWGAWTSVPQAFRRYAQAKGVEEQWKDVLKIVAAQKTPVERARGISAGADFAGSGVAGRDSAAGVSSENGVEEKRLSTEAAVRAARRRRGLHRDRPLAGAPLAGLGLAGLGLAHEPVNEAGVMFFFGMCAHLLGFRVLSVQGAFPDCEAMQEVRPGRWQRVRIELEFESRNYRKHGHRRNGCDVIVCWRHNWPECPKAIQVVELRKIIG